MCLDIKVRTALADVCQKEVYVRTGLSVPHADSLSLMRSREQCAQNLCGYYGASCTCPPSCPSPEECIHRLHQYTRCAIIIRSYAGDVSDRDRTGHVLHAFQEICRNAQKVLRMNGIDVLVLAGGPCTYCSECEAVFSRPCRFPDMQIPSISVYGIDVNSFLDDNGIGTDSVDGQITLYGLVLY